ncbi:2S albumin seed storage protein [Melia azedarach]|uniref:2S albumin seed storage protein n=1 Tax=Melia azedarach TaxID=155640 RepID=A0ACC1YSJ3_MELAZ|nr:2S albumin seed storage protein [Melia azedarach]
MAKPTVFLATFTLFLLAANASIYRTTVEIDDENPIRGRSCQEQIQQQQQLRHCQMHLRQQIRSQREEPWGSSSDDNQQQQHLRQCCQQLQELDTRCRCQGLEQAVRRQEQQGQLRGQEMQQLYETASNIPRRCNIQPRQGCDLSSSNVSF